MNNNTELSVKRVKDFYFAINERLYIADPTKVIKIELGHVLGFNVPLNLCNFTLRIYLHYIENPENILADIQVENIFEIQDLAKFQLENKLVVLPSQLITAIVSMSLSHGRALLLKNTSGTVFQEVILPITNPVEVSKHFFPYMFKEEQTIIQTDTKGNITNKVIVNKKRKVAAK
jgi:hypothetical protein